ncbi:unnamed protein product (mitochondrion) [Plasmodiophora brassicae]|uniref:Nuclear pore complex protein n=2 Tax=Plasmodiophora brassicae TaxID=37360 RepID=A0A3P3Y7X2_PLABS|nr:unnamed protein product [Plasmodiophora brassicae]
MEIDAGGDAVDVVTLVQDEIEAVDARIAELANAPEVRLPRGAMSALTPLSLPPDEAVAELGDLRAQRTVWALLSIIAGEIGPPDDAAAAAGEARVSHRALLERVIGASHDLRRCRSISAWSELCHRHADPDAVPLDWPNPFQHTLASSSSAAPVDPERERDAHADDAATATRFWRAVWRLVVAGRLYEGDEANGVPSVMQVCQASGRDHLACSLAGGLPYHSTGDDAEGNPHRWLWRSACRAAADADGASVWERAVYGVLGGQARAALPACSTWMECLWATSTCALILASDAALHDALARTMDGRVSEPLDDERWVMRPRPFTMRALVDDSNAAYAQGHPGAKPDAYRRIVCHIVLDDRQALFDDLYETMTGRGGDDVHAPSYVEFAARLYQILSDEPEADAHNARILVEFIRYLSRTRDLHHRIPAVMLSLPDDVRVREYAAVLRACVDEATRRWFLEQAQRLFPRETVARIRTALLDLVVPGDDARSVDDLIACQALDPLAAVRQANVFFRDLLARDLLDDAVRLNAALVRDASVDAGDDDRELMAWSALVKARSKIVDLQRFLSKRYDVGDALDRLQFGDTGANWEQMRASFFDIALRSTLAVVRFEGGWMRFVDADRDARLAPLRRKCLPDLVARLFAACELMGTADSNGACLDVCAAVSEDETRAYQAFDRDSLCNLLHSTRNAFLRYAATIAC